MRRPPLPEQDGKKCSTKGMKRRLLKEGYSRQEVGKEASKQQ